MQRTLLIVSVNAATKPWNHLMRHHLNSNARHKVSVHTLKFNGMQRKVLQMKNAIRGKRHSLPLFDELLERRKAIKCVHRRVEADAEHILS